MAKKEDKKGSREREESTDKKKSTGIKQEIISLVSSNITPLVKDGVQSMIRKVQDAVYHTEKKVVEDLLTAVILFAGLIFLAIGVAFLINNYFMLDRQWGFLIVGVLMLAGAYMMRAHTEKTRYMDRRR
ncbi:MAG: hypothetical protein R6U32_07555 [Candidatus Woesearchaeota archaeon]